MPYVEKILAPSVRGLSAQPTGGVFCPWRYTPSDLAALGHLKVNCPAGAREATLGCPLWGRREDGVPYGGVSTTASHTEAPATDHHCHCEAAGRGNLLVFSGDNLGKHRTQKPPLLKGGGRAPARSEGFAAGSTHSPKPNANSQTLTA